MADLRDYSYIDKPRLDNYIQQFRSTTVYDKVPIWKIIFKFTGPSVEGTQERPARQLEEGEKPGLLLDYLKKQELVDQGRISKHSYHFGKSERVFRLETCQVVSVILPPNQRANPPFKGLKMWVSEYDEQGEPNLLLLLGDFIRDDQPSFGTMSAYSALLAIANEGYDLKRAFEEADVGPFAALRREKERLSRKEMEAEARESRARAVLNDGRADIADLVAGASLYAEQKKALESQSRFSEEALREEFSKSPVQLLERLEAGIGARQMVEALYRVRTVMHDIVRPDFIVTIGYPILISSAGITA